MYKVTPYGQRQTKPNNLCQLFIISLSSESPRREVYGEGLSMPGARFLRKYREGVGPTLWDAWGTLRKLLVTRCLTYPSWGLGGRIPTGSWEGGLSHGDFLGYFWCLLYDPWTCCNRGTMPWRVRPSRVFGVEGYGGGGWYDSLGEGVWLFDFVRMDDGMSWFVA